MITIFHVSVAAFTMEPEHFFTCFQQISVSGITVSSIIITNVYVAEMQNSVQETGYFIPSSSGEFNATVDVALRSTRILLGEGGGGGGDKVGTFRHRNVLCCWSGTKTGLSSSMMSLLAQYLTLITNP